MKYVLLLAFLLFIINDVSLMVCCFAFILKLSYLKLYTATPMVFYFVHKTVIFTYLKSFSRIWNLNDNVKRYRLS